MAQQATTAREGVTFGPSENDIADRVEAAERILFSWACGKLDAKGVRKALKPLDIELLDRLNPHGSGWVDAHVSGFGTITLNF
jgi:hypothetical protein